MRRNKSFPFVAFFLSSEEMLKQARIDFHAEQQGLTCGWEEELAPLIREEDGQCVVTVAGCQSTVAFLLITDGCCSALRGTGNCVT